ncbi:MAG TPA: mechanosensitive ion channel family protein [Leptolyngbyaceae cyanobacterium M33_DOE_097]|uniref:Mechanosensitive ion channel family protein n=1 Tax=Oscillatoriales cyanobacterium SpSt-418 TaxID=2282169 RepID=A0A7C3KHP9_9CYAN|nr:mechanosensitive ion channel family protein [Leptolyngbyaceae cyanobacterium M33_DOE_097]
MYNPILFTVLSTIVLLFGLRIILFTTSKIARRINQARQADRLDFLFQGFQVLGSPAVSYLLTRLLRLASFLLIGLCFYLYLPFVLSLFPTTRRLGNQLFQSVGNLLGQLFISFVNFLPNLITISIIGIIAYFAIGFAKLVIFELGRDDAYSWFYPEWIRPTIRLANLFIVAIACVIAAPYLPGFGSPAFQGISIFLGALFTLGSTAAIANTISGIILVYTRAFRVGDVIQIGEQMGEVLEKSLFVTRILTFQNEVVTIPNSNLLNSEVKNFSSIAYERREFLRLHTTVTLGYDIPWRKIYEVMIEAAKATDHILLEPAPFVLQTSLNDYNVAYELNAFTKSPEIMPKIYSQLHENIQDYCNQAGIEILSPAFTALREGNHSTIPAEYLPSDYTQPTFQIQSQPPSNQ